MNGLDNLVVVVELTLETVEDIDNLAVAVNACFASIEYEHNSFKGGLKVDSFVAVVDRDMEFDSLEHILEDDD